MSESRQKRFTRSGGEPPKVSIGLPVYNGENYVARALESILSQTFSDFEVIISDNASTDRTEEICRKFAARDPRIRYDRSPKNVGAAPNFNRTFQLSRGVYFRWAAHDDMAHPDLLKKCVEVLDSDPSVVLCHSKVRVIDEEGQHVEDQHYGLKTGSEDPRKRFFSILFIRNRCFEVFGLIRASVLRTTGVMGAFPVGDRVLLSELAFRGRFHEIPEHLFYRRDHANASTRVLSSQRERARWFDTRYNGRTTFPEWRTFIEYVKAISRAPLTDAHRVVCYIYMLKYLRHYRKRMRSDVLVAGRTWLSRFGKGLKPAVHP